VVEGGEGGRRGGGGNAMRHFELVVVDCVTDVNITLAVFHSAYEPKERLETDLEGDLVQFGFTFIRQAHHLECSLHFCAVASVILQAKL